MAQIIAKTKANRHTMTPDGHQRMEAVLMAVLRDFILNRRDSTMHNKMAKLMKSNKLFSF